MELVDLEVFPFCWDSSALLLLLPLGWPWDDFIGMLLEDVEVVVISDTVFAELKVAAHLLTSISRT